MLNKRETSYVFTVVKIDGKPHLLVLADAVLSSW